MGKLVGTAAEANYNIALAELDNNEVTQLILVLLKLDLVMNSVRARSQKKTQQDDQDWCGKWSSNTRCQGESRSSIHALT